MAFLSKIKVVFSLFIVYCLLFIVSPVFAQSPAPSSIPYTLYPIPYTIPPTSPVYTDLLVHNLFHSFSCLAVGSSIIGQPCLTYQVTKDAQGVIQSIPVLSQTNLSGGALGATTSLIAALYMNPPVRTVDYLASLGESFGIVKEAKAQVVGSGANVLSPILTLWTVSRNIAYLVMIIIFVVVGLMVMFRNRINPQTVITAQAALPGLVIGLILITFSYFFAALLSDFAFIGTNLVGYYFSSAQGPTQPIQPNLVADTANYNVLTIFSRFAGIVRQEDVADILAGLWNSLGESVQFVLRLATSLILFQQTASTVGGAIPFPQWNALIGAGVGLVGGVIGAANPPGTIALAISVIAIFILIYAMIRLLLRLINNFLSIIFLTITAPFHFLAAALPGRQEIATGWVLNMLCNILAFPAVLAVFYFVNYLLGPLNNPPVDWPLKIGASVNPVGTVTFPLLGGMNLAFVKILAAFGALVASPSIPDIICRTIGRMGVTGQLIGQEVSGGLGAGRGYAGQVYGAGGQAGSTLGTGLGGQRQVMFAGYEADGKTPIYKAIQTQYGLPQVVGAVRGRFGGKPASGAGGQA